MVIYARIDPELEKKFRMKVLDKFGTQKGGVEKAIEEAIRKWLHETAGLRASEKSEKEA